MQSSCPVLHRLLSIALCRGAAQVAPVDPESQILDPYSDLTMQPALGLIRPGPHAGAAQVAPGAAQLGRARAER